jgi:transposase
MKSEEPGIRQKIVSLHEKRKSTREIAYLLDISKSKAAYWVKRYKETGNLEDKPRSGKPSKLSKDELNELKKVLLDFPPDRLGGKSVGWLTKMAIQYVKDTYGKTYSMRRMQELFHVLGLNLITPRSEHKNASFAARTVFRMDFKKNSKRNIWIAPSLISTK